MAVINSQEGFVFFRHRSSSFSADIDKRSLREHSEASVRSRMVLVNRSLVGGKGGQRCSGGFIYIPPMLDLDCFY